MSPTSEKQPDQSLQQNLPTIEVPPLSNPSKILTQRTTTTAMQFSGPVPPPNLLMQYEQISPGLANRMVLMAERESSHRQQIEVKIVDSHCADQTAFHVEVKRGQVLATAITIFAIAAGAYTANQGHEIAGGILGAAGIGGIAINLILGRNARPANSGAEEEAPTEPPKRRKK